MVPIWMLLPSSRYSIAAVVVRGHVVYHHTSAIEAKPHVALFNHATQSGIDKNRFTWTCSAPITSIGEFVDIKQPFFIFIDGIDAECRVGAADADQSVAFAFTSSLA